MCKYFEDRRCPSCKSLWVEQILSPLDSDDDCQCEDQIFFTYAGPTPHHDDSSSSSSSNSGPEILLCPTCKMYEDLTGDTYAQKKWGESEREAKEFVMMEIAKIKRTESWAAELGEDELLEDPIVGTPCLPSRRASEEGESPEKTGAEIKTSDSPGPQINAEEKARKDKAKKEREMNSRIRYAGIVSGGPIKGLFPDRDARGMRPISFEYKENAKRALLDRGLTKKRRLSREGALEGADEDVREGSGKAAQTKKQRRTSLIVLKKDSADQQGAGAKVLNIPSEIDLVGLVEKEVNKQLELYAKTGRVPREPSPDLLETLEKAVEEEIQQGNLGQEWLNTKK